MISLKKIALLGFLILIISSCSTTDSGDPPTDDDNSNSTNLTTDVTVLSVKDDSVYQVNVSNNGNTVEEFNLTDELGVPTTYNALDISGQLVTFYRIAGNNYSVFQKNVQTGATYLVDEICTLEMDESRNFVTNSISKLIYFTSKFNGFEPFNFIRIFDKGTEDCVRIDLQNGYGGGNGISALVLGEIAFVAQRYAPETTRFSRINLDTGQIEAEIDVGIGYSTVVDNILYLFNNDQLTTYNATTLVEINTTPFDLSLGGTFGWFETQIVGNEMLIDYIYAQPSLIGQGPATVDLLSAQYLRGNDGFLFDLRDNLVDILGVDVFIGTYSTNLQSGKIICAFGLSDGSSGGVVETNFDGEIIGFKELDYIPFEIIF